MTSFNKPGSTYVSIRDDAGIRSLSRNERSFTRDCALSTKRMLRVDGRTLNQVRPVRLQLGRGENFAECTVQWGASTRVSSFCSAELIRPSPDRPSEGQLSISVDLSPMASPSFRQAPPFTTGVGGGGSSLQPNFADPAQRLLSNRILRCCEKIILVGQTIDLEALTFIPGKFVWRLHLNLTVLDHGGNIIDACVLAALASLRHYRKPQVEINEQEEGNDNNNDPIQRKSSAPVLVPSHLKEPTPLPLHHTPLSISFAFVPAEDGSRSTTTTPSSSAHVATLVDPTDREELLQNGSLTVAMNIHAEVCLLDYGGGCELPPTQLKDCWKVAESCIRELCTTLETSLEEADKQAQQDRLVKLQEQQHQLQPQFLMEGRQADLPLPPVPFYQRAASPGDAMEIDGGDQSNKDASKDEVRRIQTEAEEAYRRQALDYSQGYKATKVREDNDHMRLSSQPYFNQAGALLKAMLHSAEPTTTSSTASGTHLPPPPTSVVMPPNTKPPSRPPTSNTAKASTEGTPKPVASAKHSDDEEETTVLLQSEFQLSEPTTTKGTAAAETANDPPPKPKVAKKAPVSLDDDDIDDLAMAITKKKKKKSKM